MAPELLDPKIPREKVRPTPASDVYSFAMVAIEVFSGECSTSQRKMILMLIYREHSFLRVPR